MKRFLITTALEETWRDDVPALFLGEWCRRYSRKHKWSKMDAEVLPYHWDDRDKLYSDYKNLVDFYERLLRDLAIQLNQIHGVEHSLRYWRILIGPWLGYFIQMLFDRWSSIQQAISHYEITGTVTLTGEEDSLVPTDMVDLIRLMVGDEWNHHIFSAIIKELGKIPCIQQPRRDGEYLVRAKPVMPWIRKLKLALASSYSRLASILVRDNDAFLLSTFLPYRAEMRMYKRLGQVPQHWRSIKHLQTDFDGNQRNWVIKGESRSEYEKFVRSMIPKQIPIIYLEGYEQLVEQVFDLPWPKFPKLIWTSNSHEADDVFKNWAAEKVEQGSPLVIGQHGGHYGVGRWSFFEDHDIAISDCYLSWGWSEPEQAKIKPLGQLKLKQSIGIQHAKQKGALLVTATAPRYSYKMYSSFVSRQWLDYFEEQGDFIQNLPEPIRNALTVRLYMHDYGWDQVRRWRDRFPEIQLDEGHTNINDLIRQSRLYISTYNATTFLESFTMNVPTVMYWNPNHWEMRDSAIPYFEELKSVGIFHETPESAAKHVANVWDDINSWWSSTEVQKVLAHFKQRYCYIPDNLLDQIEHTLREVINATDVSVMK